MFISISVSFLYIFYGDKPVGQYLNRNIDGFVNFFQKHDYLLSEDINNEIQDRTVQQAREQRYDGFAGIIGSMERGTLYRYG